MDKKEAIEKALADAREQLDRGDAWFATRSHSLKAVAANFIYGEWRVELEWIRTGRNGVDQKHEGSFWVKP